MPSSSAPREVLYSSAFQHFRSGGASKGPERPRKVLGPYCVYSKPRLLGASRVDEDKRLTNARKKDYKDYKDYEEDYTTTANTYDPDLNL